MNIPIKSGYTVKYFPKQAEYFISIQKNEFP